MENILDPQTLEIISKLIVAMTLGMIIGIERVFAHKTAGPRTYAMVSMGSALFVLISQLVTDGQMLSGGDLDPMRMASQIIVGVGFLGAGLIVHKESQLLGLTTASGLWVAAGIGVATGFGLYTLAITATILALFIFSILWVFEARLKEKIEGRESIEEVLK